MSLPFALLLGIVQAVTEFLPISSSGHLVIFQKLLKIPQATPAFDALLHLGTAFATICFYHKRIGQILTGSSEWFFERFGSTSTGEAVNSDSIRLFGLIFLSSAITALLGLPLKNTFEDLFENPPAVGVAFLFTGVLLAGTRKFQANSEDTGRDQITVLMAILIGFAQFIAITPGVSRSGATIALALMLGLRRHTAAEFSFLISIPAILGANLIKLLEGGVETNLVVVMLGIIASFIFGLAALSFLVFLVRKGKLYNFSYYLFPLGVIVLLASWSDFF